MTLNNYLLLLYAVMKLMAAVMANEESCGYSGRKGKQIEKKFDDCFNKEVKDSRLRMSLGYEKCFGFNYQQFNTTVSEPLDVKQKIANRELINLSLKTCILSEKQERRQNRVSLDRLLDNCKHYFNVIIRAMYNDDEAVETYLESQSELIKPLLKNKPAFDKLVAKIIEIIKPIDECKEPQAIFRMRLIKKYLEMYLNKIVNPPLPSFNEENLPLFEHPEVYLLKYNKVVKTDIEKLLESKRKKGMFLPEKRTIEIKGRRKDGKDTTSEEEKKKSILDKLLGFKNSITNDDEYESDNNFNKNEGKRKKKHSELSKKAIDQMLKEANTDDEHRLADSRSEDHEHDGNEVEIDDFWDDNLQIKKKKLGNHDFDRYKIKGFDIDRQLKKLFKI